MQRSVSRLGALVASGAMLATLTAAVVVAPVSAAAPACTYDMTVELPDYDATGVKRNAYPLNHGHVAAGEVVCGGAGRDKVDDIEAGGVFIGRGGDDEAAGVAGRFVGGAGNDYASQAENGGRFYGGSGADSITFVVGSGSLFRGGDGRDKAHSVYNQGAFIGEQGPDTLNYLHLDGVFLGGAGGDRVAGWIQSGGRFVGGAWKDSVQELNGGTFIGGRGRDSVGLQTGGRYYGGPKWDRVGEVDGCLGGNPQQFSVERVPAAQPC